MRSAAARSPSAGRPLAPAGLGEAQVPEASITARARMRSSWPPASTVRSSNGRSARPAVVTLPTRVRATAVTRAPYRTRPAICGNRASGSR
jgi:hypothetical protein